jgi:hypothetical protein
MPASLQILFGRLSVKIHDIKLFGKRLCIERLFWFLAKIFERGLTWEYKLG